ncbi:hypothetical protein MPSEU_000679800 [Mayamaea pseudoterrestris]|nr:hypothetical protein MPSEU_000679800 [Mayamaea pseudoterrestris]
MFSRQPTVAQMQAHSCQGEALDLSLVESELRASVETEFGGHFEILTSESFFELLSVCIGGHSDLHAFLLEFCLSAGQNKNRFENTASMRDLWRNSPSSVDYETVAKLFERMSPFTASKNLAKFPRFLQFVLLIAPTLCLPPKVVELME